MLSRIMRIEKKGFSKIWQQQLYISVIGLFYQFARSNIRSDIKKSINELNCGTWNNVQVTIYFKTHNIIAHYIENDWLKCNNRRGEGAHVEYVQQNIICIAKYEYRCKNALIFWFLIIGPSHRLKIFLFACLK